MASEGTIFCTHCGHQHASRPTDDVCVSCGESFVVDLAKPTRAEVERAVYTKPRRQFRGGVLAGALVVTSFGLLSLVGVFLVRDEPSRPASPARVIGLLAGGELTPEMREQRRKEAEALTRGALDSASIQAVINHHIGGIQRCYEKRLLEDSSLAGRVVLRWKIGPEGATGDIRVASSDLPETVSNCMVERVGTWRFPGGPPGGFEVSYPFVFKSIGFAGQTPSTP